MSGFLGLRSAFYGARDLAAAKAWYSEVLGVAPYFDEPFYVGFSVGGFELGLVPDEPPNSGGVAWGVPSAKVAFDRLVALGAGAEQPPTEVGGGIWVARVRDPFGNVLGIIENPHFGGSAHAGARRPLPAGWPRGSVALFYDDPRAAIDFLVQAFGFEKRLVVEGEGGRIEHSELVFGEALVMVGAAGGRADRPGGLPCASPRALGGQTSAATLIFVDDVDAHAARAAAAGAAIADPPTDHDYGPEYWCDRTYRAVDPEGHQWFFTARVRG